MYFPLQTSTQRCVSMCMIDTEIETYIRASCLTLTARSLISSILCYSLLCCLFLSVLGLCCCVWAFSGCNEWALLFIVVFGLLLLAQTRVWALQVWYTDFVAPLHVGSSQTRDRIWVPCIGRLILNPWTPREAPIYVF